MTEANTLLQAARKRLPSASAPGEHASRAEVAEAVNIWLWKSTGKCHALDAHYIAKLERGVVRWPSAAYRAGLRHVLGVSDDASLGFHRPRRRHADLNTTPNQLKVSGSWDARSVIERTTLITDEDLMPPNRRTILAATATLTGTSLNSALEPLLRPVYAFSTNERTVFAPPELDSAEQLVSDLRAWHSKKNTLARRAVVAQLNSHTQRLKQAPQDTPETLRAFRVGAELADIVASMAWDAGQHRHAQRYFVLAAELAHVAGDDALAAVALASLARQCFDLHRPDDGLDVVQLAQYATRRTATPRLRAVLATREGWAYAQKGDARAFHRTVRLAEDYHAEGTRDADARTPSARSLDAAELAGVIGARYRDLAQHDPKYARQAQTYIEQALRLRDSGRPRNRVFDLISLARTHLITRDPDRASELVSAALPIASTWANGRVGTKLRDFHHETAQFATLPTIKAVRTAIADLTIAHSNT
nr:hypothetical protein [Kibdelosporangium sp. MJ126-NF4]CEL13547.1 Putative regulatory protein [Kibdelosporangium sp. MJ126-NF4]CTQ99233.1 Putative regulatory protein [Kibdelosporangium sp. MJ126-NF4]